MEVTSVLNLPGTLVPQSWFVLARHRLGFVGWKTPEKG